MGRLLRSGGVPVSVTDDALSRLTTYDPSGDVVEVVQYDTGESGARLAVVGLFANGDALAYRYLPRSRVTQATERPLVVDDSVALVRASLTSAPRLLRVVFRQQAIFTAGTERGFMAGALRQYPFSRLGVALISEDTIYIGDGGEPRLARLDPTGSGIGEVRWPARQRPVRAEHVREFYDRYLSGLPDERLRSQEAIVLRRVGAPATFPFWRTITKDRLDRFWIREYSGASRERTSFLVLGKRGDLLMAVDAPPMTEVLDADDRRLLVRHVDEDGVHTVACYTLPGGS